MPRQECHVTLLLLFLFGMGLSRGPSSLNNYNVHSKCCVHLLHKYYVSIVHGNTGDGDDMREQVLFTWLAKIRESSVLSSGFLKTSRINCNIGVIPKNNIYLVLSPNLLIRLWHFTCAITKECKEYDLSHRKSCTVAIHTCPIQGVLECVTM